MKKNKGYTVNHFSGSQFLYLYNGHNKPLPCIAYFNGRTPGKKQLKGERLCFGLWFRQLRFILVEKAWKLGKLSLGLERMRKQKV